MAGDLPELPEGVTRALLEAAEAAGIGVGISGADCRGEESELVRRVRGATEPVLRGTDGVVELELGGESGSNPVLVSRRCASDGTEVLLWFDLAERRRLEQDLSRLRAQFRRVVDAAPDAIAVFGAKQLIYANAALLRLVGHPSFASLSSTPTAEIVDPSEHPKVKSALRDLVAGERKRMLARLRVTRQDGTPVDVECIGLHTEWEGEPAVLVVGRDLAERKAVQTRQIHANRRTAMGTLSAGIAHEINNPLAYVILNLEYLARELPAFDGSSERLAHLAGRLEDARHGTLRVHSILKELSQFSEQAREGRLPVDVAETLRNALKVVTPTLEGRGRVQLELAPLPTISANAGRLEQLFVNLLVNAVQALPEGRSDENLIRVSTRAGDRGSVVVEVSDNGAGIAPEHLSQVFDPFFTTKPVGVGTGLGLPICHSIVKGLGGSIGVESAVGRGTTFRVVIPPASAPPKSQTPAVGEMRAVRPGRVLVIDDEVAVATMLSRLLEDAHAVTVCTTGREALDLLLGGTKYDVVLCDLMMPDVSGMDIYETLREQAPGSERKLVFMSGGAFTRRAADFLSTVPNERLEKPFDVARVYRIVTRLLAQK